MPRWNIEPITVGERFGRYTSIDEEYRHPSHGKVMVPCRCDCGREQDVARYALRHALSTQCRTCSNGQKGIRHGQSHRSEYLIWRKMRHRCTSPKCDAWDKYGGRGIKVCARWDCFETFLADVGPRPSPKHSIDRIDVNGNYEPGNVRWATKQQQQDNRRDTVKITIDGETRTRAEWAQLTGVNWSTIEARQRKGLKGRDLIANHHLRYKHRSIVQRSNEQGSSHAKR